MINSQQLATSITQLKLATKYYLAFSGGLDSTVLLHLLANSHLKQSITAIHINHHLSVNADIWENHCNKICQQWGIAYQSFSVNAKPKNGESPEEAARIARYNALSTCIYSEDCLLTAHHQNDQAETVLLQLLRGGGIRGIAAMPAIKSFAKGFLIRPLLNITRVALLTYAQHHRLSWIDDESNLIQKYDRNYLRNTVLPVLTERWPHVNELLSKLAQQCAEDSHLLTELAKQDMESIAVTLNVAQDNFFQEKSLRDLGKSLSPTLSVNPQKKKKLLMSSLMCLSEARQRNVLRYWLHKECGLSPSRNLLQQIQQSILLAKQDAQPKIKFKQFVIARYDAQLVILDSVIENQLLDEVTWVNLKTPCVLPASLGVLSANWVTLHTTPILQIPQNAQLTIKFRMGGERFHPQGRQGSHPLKKLFQEWGVPVWERNRIPLLYWNEELIAVGDFAIADKYVAAKDQAGIKIIWNRIDFTIDDSADTTDKLMEV